MKYFYSLRIIIVTICTITIIEGRRCPSYCTAEMKGCKDKGGKIVGYCLNGLACCDVTIKETGSCGAVKTGLMTATFVSPNYPNSHNGDLLCTFGFVFMEESVAAKVEFMEIEMDGLGFAGHGGSCDSDMIYFKGFKSWTPPALCGNLTGYTTVIERTRTEVRMNKLDIVAVMSSLKYKFKIRISQILDPKIKPKDSGKLLSPISEDMRYSERRNLSPLESIAKAFKLPWGQPLTDENSLQDAIKDQSSLYTDPFDDPIGHDEDIDALETPLIVRGDDTDITEVPWQVSIRIRYVPTNGTNSTDAQDDDDADTDTENETRINDGIMVNGNYSLASNDTEELNLTSTTAAAPTKVERNCSNEEGSHFCGGTIISNRFILTAAHCFHGNSKQRGMEVLEELKIIVGDTDSCTRDLIANGSRLHPNLTQEEYDIETVVIHYGYDDTALINDVAIIKLKRPLNFNVNIRKIRMANPSDTFEGQEALGSGWGLTNLTEPGSRLPYVLQSSPHFLIRNQSQCDKESERLFGARMKDVIAHPKYATAFKSVICTATNNATREKLRGEVLVGPGDSGGPLVVHNENGEQILIGIVSYGIPPANPKNNGEFIDFFQSVAFFHDWISIAMTV